jgi:hypothetical protein
MHRFNKIGNREMYMDCAVVNIVGAKDSDMSPGSDDNAAIARARLATLPPMYVANLKGINSCATKETTDVYFDNPGGSVIYGDGMGAGGATGAKGTCAGVGRKSASGPMPALPNSSPDTPSGGGDSQAQNPGSSNSGACNLNDGQWHPDGCGNTSNQDTAVPSSNVNPTQNGMDSNSNAKPTEWSAASSSSPEAPSRGGESQNHNSGSSGSSACNLNDGQWHPDGCGNIPSQDTTVPNINANLVHSSGASQPVASSSSSEPESQSQSQNSGSVSLSCSDGQWHPNGCGTTTGQDTALPNTDANPVDSSGASQPVANEGPSSSEPNSPVQKQLNAYLGGLNAGGDSNEMADMTDSSTTAAANDGQSSASSPQPEHSQMDGMDGMDGMNRMELASKKEDKSSKPAHDRTNKSGQFYGLHDDETSHAANEQYSCPSDDSDAYLRQPNSTGQIETLTTVPNVGDLSLPEEAGAVGGYPSNGPSMSGFEWPAATSEKDDSLPTSQELPNPNDLDNANVPPVIDGSSEGTSGMSVEPKHSAPQPSQSTTIATNTTLTTFATVTSQPPSPMSLPTTSISASGNSPPYANGDTNAYLPCRPGKFLCKSATEFYTCGQFEQPGWTYGALRQVAAGTQCQPKLSPDDAIVKRSTGYGDTDRPLKKVYQLNHHSDEVGPLKVIGKIAQRFSKLTEEILAFCGRGRGNESSHWRGGGRDDSFFRDSQKGLGKRQSDDRNVGLGLDDGGDAEDAEAWLPYTATGSEDVIADSASPEVYSNVPSENLDSNSKILPDEDEMEEDSTYPIDTSNLADIVDQDDEVTDIPALDELEALINTVVGTRKASDNIESLPSYGEYEGDEDGEDEFPDVDTDADTSGDNGDSYRQRQATPMLSNSTITASNASKIAGDGTDDDPTALFGPKPANFEKEWPVSTEHVSPPHSPALIAAKSKGKAKAKEDEPEVNYQYVVVGSGPTDKSTHPRPVGNSTSHRPKHKSTHPRPMGSLTAPTHGSKHKSTHPKPVGKKASARPEINYENAGGKGPTDKSTHPRPVGKASSQSEVNYDDAVGNGPTDKSTHTKPVGNTTSQGPTDKSTNPKPVGKKGNATPSPVHAPGILSIPRPVINAAGSPFPKPSIKILVNPLRPTVNVSTSTSAVSSSIALETSTLTVTVTPTPSATGEAFKAEYLDAESVQGTGENGSTEGKSSAADWQDGLLFPSSEIFPSASSPPVPTTPTVSSYIAASILPYVFGHGPVVPPGTNMSWPHPRPLGFKLTASSSISTPSTFVSSVSASLPPTPTTPTVSSFIAASILPYLFGPGPVVPPGTNISWPHPRPLVVKHTLSAPTLLPTPSTVSSSAFSPTPSAKTSVWPPSLPGVTDSWPPPLPGVTGVWPPPLPGVTPTAKPKAKRANAVNKVQKMKMFIESKNHNEKAGVEERLEERGEAMVPGGWYRDDGVVGS